MPRLYFDIDGTLLDSSSGLPKPALAGGAFEATVRQAGFDELICVGNFVAAIRAVWEVQPEYDGLGAIFSLTGGVFADEAWFRRVTRLVGDPVLRAAEIEMNSDWWYVDDEGERYFSQVNLREVWEQHLGTRIFRPSPCGDGTDVLEWIHLSTRMRSN